MLSIIRSKISIINFKIFSRLFHLLVWIGWGLSIQTMHANPIDGVVSAGQATINSQPNYTEITQQSERAVIDWGKFDITANEHTNFQQPSSNAVTLNRIHSNESSNINGRLTANGKLILVNQNGIIFGRDSKVDVNGLLATSSNVSNQQFMTGVNNQRQLLFNQAGNADAAIVNEGEIHAAKGLVGLVAPKVLNSGIISAKLGKVALATGDQFTVDLYGDKLLNIAVSDENRKQLLINSGEIIADGGEILLTGSAGKKIVNNLIINSGVLAARSVEERDGKIIIFAEGSNAVKGNVSKAKGKKQGQSGVLIRGLVDVSGLNRGEKGGKLQISGDEIVITDAIINASGYEGKAGTTVGLEKSAKRVGSAGGEILIGGDYLGKGKIPAAERLLVDRDVVIFNDAIEKGDAGRNIFWSDGVTSFHGKVFGRALGGKGLSSKGTGKIDRLDELREKEGSDSVNPILGGNLGDGGFVETSGKKKLDARGYVNLLASNGATGTYLLDPSTVNIYGNFDPKFVSTDGSINLSNYLAMWLDFSDQTKVQLSYQNVLSGSTYAPVSITVEAASGANTLTVSNANDLKIGARIKLGATGLEYANVTETSDGQAANNTNIYTITGISGSNLTITPKLKQNYSINTILYQGYVNTVYDKSGGNNNGFATKNDSMPAWLYGKQNNLGVASQFRGVEFLSIKNANPNIAMDYIKDQTNFTYVIGFRAISGQSQVENLFCIGDSRRIDFNHILFRPYCTNNAVVHWFFKSYNSEYFLGSNNGLILNAPNVASFYNNYDSTKFGLYLNGSLSTSSNPDQLENGPIYSLKDITPNLHFLGARHLDWGTGNITDALISLYGSSEIFSGDIYEAIEYKTALINNTRNLLEQYQSSKWNIPLLSNPTTSYNAGINGVSNLTSDYLMKLSTTADVSVLADNVNLDLKNGTMNIFNDKNFNITARSSLIVASKGTINTTRSTTGGNIVLQVNSGNVDLTNLTLNANNGGSINISNTSATGNITLGSLTATQATVTTSGGNINMQTSSGNIDLTNTTLTANNGGSINITAAAGSITAGNMNASSILLQAQGVSGDIIIPNGKTLTTY